MNGSLNPLSLIIRESISILGELGFVVFEGPEIETEWFNFDALNVPADHPSRDVQDTFWLKEINGKRDLLRTHTTSVDVRVMKEGAKSPIRAVIPGRCFRNEKLDATHEATLHQIDAFALDKNISMSNLVGTLDYYLKKLLGKEVKMRLRPHYYPFVEPGMDVDIYRDGKWMEMLGSGMLHPKVIKNMGLEPNQWQGFAFGIGVDRLAMVKYGIKNIRLFCSGDLRFLSQFKNIR
jgi:phenylalanyl-tRNA synthetase alpha chain